MHMSSRSHLRRGVHPPSTNMSLAAFSELQPLTDAAIGAIPMSAGVALSSRKRAAPPEEHDHAVALHAHALAGVAGPGNAHDDSAERQGESRNSILKRRKEQQRPAQNGHANGGAVSGAGVDSSNSKSRGSGGNSNGSIPVSIRDSDPHRNGDADVAFDDSNIARRNATSGSQSRRNGKGPKKPLSPYMYFVKEHRTDVLRKNPGIKFAEMGRMLGEHWRQLLPDQRAPFERMAEQDKARYVEEVKTFEEERRLEAAVPDLESAFPGVGFAFHDPNSARERAQLKDSIRRPMSSYMFFVQHNRERVVRENPSADFREIGRLLGSRWKEVPAVERSKYERMGEADRERYRREVDEKLKVRGRKRSAEGRHKRSVSSYFCFVRERRPQLSSQNPEADFSTIGRLLGEEWRAMGQSQKQKYVDMSTQERARLRAEEGNWNNKRRNTNRAQKDTDTAMSAVHDEMEADSEDDDYEGDDEPEEGEDEDFD